MRITEAMEKYRLPNPTTPEDLGCRSGVCLPYGEFQFYAGVYWQGPGRPDVYAVIYETLDPDGLWAESTIGLCAATEPEFEDIGHAIEWAISYIKEKLEPFKE